LRGRVEDQVMVTEFKGEDTDAPVNAVTRIAEDQDFDPPVIEASDWSSNNLSSMNATTDKWLEDMITWIQNL